MKTTLSIFFTCVLFASTISTLAAPQQNGTAFPGQATQGRVWIENHGADEAIPVTLQPQGSNLPPLRVQVMNTPTTTVTGIIQARAVRQTWEYRTISVASGQDPTTLLNAAGADGWEAIGVAIATTDAANVLMKRAR